jgi:hypothetical protein
VFEQVLGFTRYRNFGWFLVEVFLLSLFPLTIVGLLPPTVTAIVYFGLMIVYVWFRFNKYRDKLTKPQYWIGLLMMAIVIFAVGLHIFTYSDEANLHLDFAIQRGENGDVVYRIRNSKDILADSPRIEFCLYAFTPDGLNRYNLKIPIREFSYVGPSATFGPIATSEYSPGILRDYLSARWTTFGYVVVSCKNCSARKYWLYVSPNESWMSEFQVSDTFDANSFSILRDRYIEKTVPPKNRVKLGFYE